MHALHILNTEIFYHTYFYYASFAVGIYLKFC